VKQKFQSCITIQWTTFLSSLIPQAYAKLRLLKELKLQQSFLFYQSYHKGDYDVSGMIASYHDIDSSSTGYFGARGEVYQAVACMVRQEI